MDLSNVPFFQRPMSARENDKPTGNVDEAGNQEYVSATGQTYFVKPNPDQRTTRTKIEEDVVPAVKDFAANPSLPSVDQMKQFGVDVAEGTYDSIKGAVEGTGTMGDAFGVAPAMAVAGAAFEVPEDALRLFGGPKAREANRQDLQEFVKKYRGKDSETQKQLWQDLGWGINSKGEVRFEIDDSQFKYKGVDTPRDFYRLDEVIEHDELFRNYPQLNKILISEQTAYDPNELMGEMRLTSQNIPYINIAAGLTPEEKKLTILHELQHVIQFIEDPRFKEAYQREVSYQRNPAEIEAFAVEPRADMTKEQRRETMPNFAEGGSVEAQMQDLSVDPVSGNEIPPGSLPEEVRDDVDAKLSEGEYVVPADVVRFFGVDYFEKLRKKAKEGMAQMEEDGRIGGEPLPAEGMEDDLPFSDEELMAIEGEGGEAPVGMAQGGSVRGTFNPADWSAGYSSQGSGVENKTYINRDGEQRTIMFVNGQPIQQIPAGYVEATAENRAEMTRQQVTSDVPAGEVVTEFEGGQGTSDSDQGFAPDAPDIGNMSAAELGDFAQNEFGAMQGIANAAGMFGLGAVAKGAVSMTGKAVENRAEELGIPNPLGKDGKQGLIGKAIDAAKGLGAPSEAAMAAAAPAGMSYSAETGGYSRSGSAAPTSSPNPPSMSAAMAAQTGRGAPTASVSTSGRGGGGGSSGGSSGGASGDAGEAGYGGGYGGYAARGMLVDKKVRQKQKPKPEGKGLVKRKPKSK